MQPEQPYISPDHNPYEFITSPPPPQKPAILGGGSSMIQRILVVAGGAVVLLIIVIIFVSLLSGNSGKSASLTPIIQEQNELIRVAGLGTQQAVGQSAKNIAVNAQLSLTTEQQKLISFIKAQGLKLSAQQLAATQNPNTDKQLAAATASSTFDSTFLQIMQTQLTNYSQALKQAFNATTKTSERQLLSNDYSAAQLLLKQFAETTT